MKYNWDLYKKVNKSEEHPRGERMIENGENPFLKPCMLCICAQPERAESLFGITKVAMRAARIRVSPDKSGPLSMESSEGARFDMDSVDANFLSIYEKVKKSPENNEFSSISDKRDKRDEEFVKKYFVPLISENESKIDINQAMKNLRNINIFGYCNGLETVNHFFEILQNEAKNVGYSKDEINKMISQVAVVDIATEMSMNENPFTSIDFFDFKDEEIDINPNNITREAAKGTIESKNKEHLEVYSNNRASVTYVGKGIHDLKKYLYDGTTIPVVLSRAVSNCLENSINNSKSNGEFIPLNMDVLTEGIADEKDKDGNVIKKGIISLGEDGFSRKELMQKLDESLNYGGAKKYKPEEIPHLDKLDKLYQENGELTKTVNSLYDDRNEYKAKVLATAEQNCTADTFKKFNTENYQYSADELNVPGDRQVIEMQKNEIDSQRQVIETQQNKIDSQLKELELLKEKNAELMEVAQRGFQMQSKLLNFASKVKQSTIGKIFFRKELKQLPPANDEKNQNER